MLRRESGLAHRRTERRDLCAALFKYARSSEIHNAAVVVASACF